MGKPYELQTACLCTGEVPNRPICCIPHRTVLRVNKSLVPFRYIPQMVLPPQPFVSPWISCPISSLPRQSLTYLSASLLIPVFRCSVSQLNKFLYLTRHLFQIFASLSLPPPYFSAVHYASLIPRFPASVCPSPWFVWSRCHAVLCGSSGDELPLLVNSPFILQPYQPHCRVSSRQLQSRLPSLIMSSDQDFHTSTHSEYAHLRSNNNNNNNKKTHIYTVHEFTARSLTCLVYSHTHSHEHMHCVCVCQAKDTIMDLTVSWKVCWHPCI